MLKIEWLREYIRKYLDTLIELATTKMVDEYKRQRVLISMPASRTISESQSSGKRENQTSKVFLLYFNFHPRNENKVLSLLVVGSMFRLR